MRSKKVLALVVTALLFLGLIPANVALAVVTDDFALQVRGTLDSEVKVNGQPTMVLDFRVQTFNGKAAGSGGGVIIVFDKTLFEFANWDPSDEFGSPIPNIPVDNSLVAAGYEMSTVAAGWSDNAYLGKNDALNLGYLQLAIMRTTGTRQYTTMTTLQSMRLALKPGKTPNDIRESSIRLLTKAELPALSQVSIALISDGVTSYRYAGDSINDTLAAPTLTFPFVADKITLNAVITPAGKTYDGSAAATASNISYTGISGSDNVYISGGTLSFEDKNAGVDKTVTASGWALSGTDAGKYQLGTITVNKASITPASLSATITPNNKSYDGNATATVQSISYTGKIGSDDVSISGGSLTFANKNVGTGKAVSASGWTLSGTDKNNYTLSGVTATAATITSGPVVNVVFTANDKVYDGGVSATLKNVQYSGIIGSDDVSVTGGALAFANKSAGGGKSVTASGWTITGADAGNYTLGTVTANTATINPATLNATIAPNNKAYNGNASATVYSISYTGKVVTDNVSISGGSLTFADKNVGTGKAVTASGYALSGTDAGNYTLGTVSANTANITPSSISATITPNNKSYDGNTTATVQGISYTGKFGSDDVYISGGSLTFANANVGTGKTVTASGWTLAGTDKNNYTLTGVTATTANITSGSVINAVFTVNDKTYDGSASATMKSVQYSGIIGGDDVYLTGGSLAFADKNVGSGKTVTASGWTLAGAKAGNYTLGTVSVNNAAITPATLNATITPNNKTYNSTTAASLGSISYTGKVGTEDVSISGGSLTFADKNAGNNKAVTAGGWSLAGTDKANYTLGTLTVNTANITPLTLSVTINTISKKYDGTTSASSTSWGFSGGGIYASDDAQFSFGPLSFADKNVGTGKTVTTSGWTFTGADTGNYTISTVTVQSANITPATVNATITPNDKDYDGTTAATVKSISYTGIVGSEDVSISGGSLTFSDKHAGASKAAAATGWALSGTDRSNYTLSFTVNNAKITPVTLNATITPNNKTYNSTTAASLASISYTGIVGTEDVLISGGSLTFADKNAGNNKAVTASGWSLAGSDKGNYALGTLTVNTANITSLTLSVIINTVSKKYDGTTSASSTGWGFSGVGIYASDDAQFSFGPLSFADKNVGTGKTVTTSGWTFTGADTGNYTINTVTVQSANITQATVNATITPNDKDYDGTVAATVKSISYAGIVGTEDVSIAGGSVEFADAAIGDNKTVSVKNPWSLAGADKDNYTLGTISVATASIKEVVIPSYDITVVQAENGTVSVDKQSAKAGEKVTVTATPAEGFSLAGIFVNGTAIEGNEFTMPAGAVTVTAEFKASTEIISVELSTDKIYEGYGARIPIVVDAKYVGSTAQVTFNGVITEVVVAAGTEGGLPVGRMGLALDKAPAAGTYTVSVSLPGATGSADITVEAITVDLWNPILIECTASGLKIRFGSPISGNITTDKGSASVDPDGKTLTVAFDNQAAGKITISGVKYAEIFPSYVFTFKVDYPTP